jgi:hypothetical protein
MERRRCRIGAVDGAVQAWLLSLDSKWFRCDVAGSNRLSVSNAAQGIEGGMSGSPILVEGAAIGVLGTSMGVSDSAHTEGGPQPALAQCLPQWLATELLKRGDIASGL